MPSKNEKQRRALFAKKGSKWVHEHHFDKIAPKPSVKKGNQGKRKR